MGREHDALSCLPWSPKGTVPGREKLPRGAGSAFWASTSWGGKGGGLSEIMSSYTLSRNSLDHVTSFRIVRPVVRVGGKAKLLGRLTDALLAPPSRRLEHT